LSKRFDISQNEKRKSSILFPVILSDHNFGILEKLLLLRTISKIFHKLQDGTTHSQWIRHRRLKLKQCRFDEKQ
jgi:hypothetical protein